jgi:uncharacterized membrane protein
MIRPARQCRRDVRPMCRCRRDDGRVSVFVAITFMAVLIVIGLTVDAAGKYRAMQRAENLAAEAARTGGQQIDVGQAVAGDGQFLDFPAATQAVSAYLAGMPGVVGHQTTPLPGGQGLQVTVDMTYQTTMLSLFGYPASITVTGQATAVLQTDP